MELTTLQKELVYLLKAYEIQQNEAVGVMLLLDTEEKQIKMYEWIELNTAATVSEVIEAAMHIHKE